MQNKTIAPGIIKIETTGPVEPCPVQTELDTLRTPEKLAVHEREDAKPATKFLYAWCGQYHLGVRRELRYEKTGLIMKAYYVCKCTGRKLNSYATEHDELPKYPVQRCKRCFGAEGGYR